MGEHLPCKQGVVGSNPTISTISKFEIRYSKFEQRKKSSKRTLKTSQWKENKKRKRLKKVVRRQTSDIGIEGICLANTI